MSKSHYETIGVRKDSSPAEIKRVFRAKAASAHPDKHNGSHDEMAALNRAYETLIDPKRRLLYDRTGEDEQRPADEQARSFLMLAFNDALQKDVPDALAHARQCLDNARSELRKQQVQVVAHRDKLKARRDKISCKRGPNAFHLVVDQQLQQAEQNLAKIEQDFQNYKAVERELKKYRTTEEVLTSLYMPYAATGSTSASSW